MVRKFLLFLLSRPILSLFLSLAWTLLIFIGCSLPGRELPQVSLFDHVDKVVHVLFFFLFFILWSLSFGKKGKYSLTIFLTCVLYGFCLEWYQLLFVDGRSFDVWDAVADTVGGALGYTLWHWFVEYEGKKRAGSD